MFVNFRPFACILFVGLFFGSALGASAKNEPSELIPGTIKDYWHTAWRQRDGAPASIWAVAQTPDGWLWLATPSGLYRFDGAAFEPFDLLPADDPSPRSVADLYVSEQGSLWVLYSAGGAAVWSRGAAQGCCLTRGLPLGMPIDGFAEIPSGQMLALVGETFFLLDHDHWVSVASSVIGLNPRGVYSFQRFGDELWVAAKDGLYAWSKEQQTFVARDKRDLGESNLLVSGDGELWRYTVNEGYVLVQRGPAGAVTQSVRARTSSPFLIDRQGSMWSVVCHVATLCRFRNALHLPGPIPLKALRDDQFGVEDGFPAEGAMTGYEDRQGNLWFGTKLGLERFTPQAFSAVHFPEPLIYFAMTRGPGGAIWVGTASVGSHDYWWSVDGPHATRWGAFASPTTATYDNQDGTVLVGSQQGLWRFDGDTFASMDFPPSAKNVKPQAIVRDKKGRLWVSYRGKLYTRR